MLTFGFTRDTIRGLLGESEMQTLSLAPGPFCKSGSWAKQVELGCSIMAKIIMMIILVCTEIIII